MYQKQDGAIGVRSEDPRSPHPLPLFPVLSSHRALSPPLSFCQVLICQNRLAHKSQDYFDTVVSHELIHSFDFCRAHTDFTNTAHHACTEVRAANLSGECSWWREVKRGVLQWKGHQEKCVRRRAIISVLGNPAIRDVDEARAAVGNIFDRCYRDVQPHGSIPT